ncbi:MAG TPA: hypothetical protein EYQ62_01855, partial [Verrucomicrobiales bacterium]|nr:hypothetical protein [Verrucomicrobiales bacterium]
MKNVILILAVAGVASGATYWVVSTGKTSARDGAAADLAREHEEARAGMRSKLNVANSQRPVIITVDGNEGEAPTVATVEEILARLQELKAGDKRVKRRAVYFLESLVDRGDAALPGIAKFLERNVDLELQSLARSKAQVAKEEKNGGDKDEGKGAKKRAAAAWNYFRPFPKPNDEFPATLRLGLLEVVTAIGSTRAEQLLLTILGNT